MSSGATSAERCRPVSPPAVRKICSEQVSGASARGQHAVGLDPRVQPGRPVGVRGQHDQRARRVPAGQPGDGLGRPLADLRAARDDHEVHHRRPGRDVPPAPLAPVRRRRGPPGPAAPRSGPAPSRCRRSCGRVDAQRIVGSPGIGGSASSIRPPPAGRVPTAMISPSARSPPSAVTGLRSSATGAPRGRAGRRRSRGPTCPPRSWGSPAPASRPRPRRSGPRWTTPPRPRRRG